MAREIKQLAPGLVSKIRSQAFQLTDLLVDDDFFQLVKKVKQGETEEWDVLLQACPLQHALLHEAMTLLNSLQIEVHKASTEQIAADWKVLQQALSAKHKRKKVYFSLSIAASLVLLLGLSFFLKTASSTNNSKEILSMLSEMTMSTEQIEVRVGADQKLQINQHANIVQKTGGSLTINEDKTLHASSPKADFVQVLVPYGKRLQIEFCDGTKAWVNSGTKLVYPFLFSDSQRDIYVDGEVYLEVRHDSSSPFFVHSKEMQIQVMGTSFNLSAYSDDEFSSVVLVEGSVNVLLESGSKESLQPNQRLSYSSALGSDLQQVDVCYYTGWKDGYLKLNSEPLESIFKKLSRYYNVNILFDQELAPIKFKGKLDLSNDIDKTLNYIALTEQISYHIDNKEIQIQINK